MLLGNIVVGRVLKSSDHTDFKDHLQGYSFNRLGIYHYYMLQCRYLFSNASISPYAVSLPELPACTKDCLLATLISLHKYIF